MKKHSSRKLTLQRETITTLQGDALDAVAGGATTVSTATVSISITVTVSTISTPPTKAESCNSLCLSK
jgi:hypothetical protein